MKKENNLDINYVYKYENQNIDINKLRPNKSYDYLIENTNQDLKKKLNSKKKIKKFLLNRKCPSCDSNKKR